MSKPRGSLYYQEIENYATSGNDVLEVVMQYSYDTSSHIKIWYAIYNGGTYTGVDYLDVSVGNTITYEWYISGTTYYLWFLYGGTFHNATFTDTSTPTNFYHFDGSSEFDTVNSLNGHTVNTWTYPLSVENLYLSTGSWATGTSYVNSHLSKTYSDPDRTFVSITSTLDSTNGLRFYEAGGSMY